MNAPLPAFSIYILNWNGRTLLEECLQSVYAQEYPAERVELIDNGSTDASVAFVRQRFPQTAVRLNGGNLGYAAGNNAALRHLSSEVALLLNPDVVLSPNFLKVMAETLAADASAGIAGAKLWYPNGEPTHRDAVSLAPATAATRERYKLQHGGGYITHPRAVPGHYGIGERDEGQHDATRDVDYVIGAALAVRREVLERVGLFDERFFLYYEDADLCTRARAAGYRVVYVPEATGVHVESATTVKGSLSYLWRFHTGRWLYLLKHFPAGELLEATLPDERAWLGRLDADERRAASLAYLTARRRLPEMWSAREREGAGPLPTATRVALERMLIELHEHATPGLAAVEPPDALLAAATLEARPFVSTAPLIGPLIARFRTAWNNVASRWYIQHVIDQQNEFNRLAVAQLAEQLTAYEREARQQLELLEQQIVERTEMEQRLQQLSAQLVELERRLTEAQRKGERPGS
jgi:GT2 family glycosyltransferase